MAQCQPLKGDHKPRHVAPRIRHIEAVPVAGGCAAIAQDHMRRLEVAVARTHLNRAQRRRRKFQAVEESSRFARQRLAQFSDAARPSLQCGQVVVRVEDRPSLGSYRMESRQPSRTALGRQDAITLLARQE